MKSQFQGRTSPLPSPQGHIRVVSEMGTIVSVKPYQIRCLLTPNEGIKPKWHKETPEKEAWIVLFSASETMRAWAVNHPVNTSLDILEQIIDAAESGHSFDLIPYSGNDAKKLENISEIMPVNTIKKRTITVSAAPTPKS